MIPPQTVVMVTTSYPRFPGDSIATFMEPIARGVAARGHRVHLVAPWHPAIRRPPREDGLHFHFFRYAPVPQLNVFGYAAALRADVNLRGSALLAAPLALLSGWQMTRRVVARTGATILHGHWVVPGGAIAAAAGRGLPLVVSLHGSDVYVAERHAAVGAVARLVLRRADRITACSHDLRNRAVALGASTDRIEVVPYGVDASRFAPDPEARRRRRDALGLPDDTPLLFTAGRLVRKKGFEFLIEAVGRLRATWPTLTLAIAGGGDLETELRQHAGRQGVADRVRFLGPLAQDEIPSYLAAADLAVVPSVRDPSGNVDGLPNVLMEALASGTPVVTTTAGGIGAVASDAHTARVVPEGDATALATAIAALLTDPSERSRLGSAARARVLDEHGWTRAIERLEAAYARALRSHRPSGLPPV